MKVAVVAFTGTVGKTTIAAHMLSPRMNNATVFSIESINETAGGLGLDVEQLKGDQFRAFFKQIIELDDAIVDVGASNVEEFLDGIRRFEDSHDEIDFFVIPVIPSTKSQKETLRCVEVLNDLGIPSDKIRILFNRVSEDVESEFPTIMGLQRYGMCVVNPKAAVYENEVFDMLSIKKLTMEAAMQDPTDYRAKLRELGKDGDARLKSQYADMHAIKALAKPLNRQFDAAFEAIFA